MEPQKGRKRYQKINGCSHPPSLAMIVALLLVVIIVVLHALVVGAIADINHAVLSVLLAFNYVLLAVMAVDYLILVLTDPADPRLYEENFEEKEKDLDMLVMCKFCEKRVHIYSYHCRTCKRCVDQFDHHCIFLNNCIGRPNYSNFFRLLLTLSLFLLINMGEGIWVAISSEDSSRWIAVTLAIVSGLIIPQVIGLMGFHCYISLCLYKTTLQVIRGEIDPETKKRVRDYTPKKQKKKPTSTREIIHTEVQIKRQSQL